MEIVILQFDPYLPVCISFQVEGSSETTEKVKKSLSSFLGVITDTLAPPPDKTIDCDVITLVATPAGTTEVYDSSKVGVSYAYPDILIINCNSSHLHYVKHCIFSR